MTSVTDAADLESAFRSLSRDGFAVVPDVLSHTEVERVRSRLVEVARSERTAMYLHSDQDYVPLPWPPFPLVANIIWMLDDFTEENGATRFIPGSHHEDHTGWTPDVMNRRSGETVAVGGRAGSLVCLDGRVLHQTGANATIGQLRHGIIAYYCQPWIRQQENASLSILPEVWPNSLVTRA